MAKYACAIQKLLADALLTVVLPCVGRWPRVAIRAALAEITSAICADRTSSCRAFVLGADPEADL